MARRRKVSGGGDLIDGLATLPWQWCLALAPVAWLLFHWMAQLDPPPARDVKQMGDSIFILVFKTAGMFLQYLAPLALVLAGLVSWLRKRRRKTLLVEAEASGASAPLRALSWREFEQIVGAHFERQGYTVSFTPDGADGGVDVIAKRDGDTYLIQCKQWRASKVGVSVVRELFGVMAARGAAGGFVVSIGAFTQEAQAFARGRNLELVDASALIGAASSPPETSRAPPPEHLSAPESCPRCGAPMVRRTAQRGANQGRAFWGCSTFPRCRETRPA